MRYLSAQTALGLSLLLTGIAQPAWAHHGVNSEFDVTKDVDISGTLSRARLVNPHSYLYIESTTNDDKPETWACEMGSWTALKRDGWTKDMLQTGTHVTVHGHPSRTEALGCVVEQLSLADGTQLDTRPEHETSDTKSTADEQAQRATTQDGTPTLAGNWAAIHFQPLAPGAGGPPGEHGPQLGPRPDHGMPPSGGMPPEGADRPAQSLPKDLPVTAAAKTASKGYDRDDNPRFNCMATNIFEDWTFDEMVNHIEQTADTVHIDYGFMDLERTIYLNQVKHPSDLTPSRAGHSIGHWENGKLVVDTRGFTPGYLLASPMDGVALMNSAQLHTVETFWRDEDGVTLHRSYTIEDPIYLTEPLTGQDDVVATDDAYEEYHCDDLTNAGHVEPPH
ncbi:DUF6152 family protein [Cobetia sp. L2A1]|uniref:DUF6152 family protein n=1 Tax=Cobetia sp. L2A1 TaxID=2686360 RepID=UPI00227956D1|nr:DUF6152 family protein [Cobetia sp. L2A1]